jgi:predicted metal-binding membrane protein
MPLRAARNQPALIAATLAAAGLAWWWTVQRMAGMTASPGTDLGTLGWFTGSWVAMMAAMMLPSFAPSLVAYATLTRGRAPARWLAFAGGYLLVWTAAGLVAYAIFELGRSLLAGDLAWHDGGRWLSGTLIALAAAYQFSPPKRASLSRCRGQLAHAMDDSRVGSSATFAMGLQSGAWCIGCSWALMLALFALGVMSLTWMALIAAFVAFEKTGPRPSAARFATAAVLAALAVGVLAAPQEVPGLVVPGSGAMHGMTMKAMG